MNMKKAIITASLLCASVSANASTVWTDLGGGVFYDKKSVIKEKGLVTVWAMFNSKEGIEGAHSVKHIAFINCKRLMIGQTYVVAYSGENGLGQVILSGDASGPMQPIIPASKGEILADGLCGAN